MTSIYSTDEGTGLPVLFIHGFCETHEMWGDFKIPFLAHHRVITIDLPGFGNSTHPEGNFSIRDIADSVNLLLKEKSIDKCVAIGHSLGGYVLLEMVKKSPEYFAGISLFHSTALADSEEKRESRNKTIDFVEKRGVKVFAESFVPSLFYQKNRKTLTKEIEKAVNIASKTSLATLVSYTKAMRDRVDRTDVLKDFEGPISIIAGQNDTSVPVDKIQEQELLPKHGIVNYLENCGHMGMHEKKKLTTDILKNFLEVCK